MFSPFSCEYSHWEHGGSRQKGEDDVKKVVPGMNQRHQKGLLRGRSPPLSLISVAICCIRYHHLLVRPVCCLSQAKREERLMREAEKELRLRHRQRRARSLRVRPKSLPGLQFANSKYFGCFSLPALDGLRDRLATSLLPGRITKKMRTIRRVCEG